MVIALLAGAIIGFILAVPPGPVGVSQIRFGLHGDKRTGGAFAYGVGAMDAVYCLIAIFATSAAEAAIGSFTRNHPYIVFTIQVLIVFFFVVFGIINVRSKTGKINIEDENNKTLPAGSFITKKLSIAIDNLKHKGPFLLGVGIALTNLPNPTFLPSLAYITMTVHQFQLIRNDLLNNVTFALAYGLGNVLWLIVLLKLVLHFKSRMSDTTVIRIRQFAGVTFIGFGTFLGYRLIMLTKVPEIFRLLFTF